jgi:HEPN domain-containing protein
MINRDWVGFARAGDEWIVSYALPGALLRVKLFSVGQALELYLKAFYIKKTGDTKKAIEYRHRIKELWDACKQLDNSFMPSYEIRDSIFKLNATQYLDIETNMGQEEMRHYLQNQDLYTVMRMLPDLKYVGTPLTSPRALHGLVMMNWHPYWIPFFQQLRSNLGHPEQEDDDGILYLIRVGLPIETVEYLSQLYE